jgi:hypothetical protein
VSHSQSAVDGAQKCRLLLESHEQLLSLEHPTGISISWAPDSLTQRHGSCMQRDADCTLDSLILHSTYVSLWSRCSLHEGVHYHAAVFTTLYLIVVFVTIIAVHSLHLPMNFCWLTAHCTENWNIACWSWLDRCGLWRAIFCRLPHVTPLNRCTNTNATDDILTCTFNVIMRLYETVLVSGTHWARFYWTMFIL